MQCFFRTFELSKHRRYFARIKDAIPGQLKAVDKLLDPRIMGSSDDTAYAGPKLAEDAMFGEGFGASKLAKALRSHHGPQESSRAQCSVQLRRKSWPEIMLYVMSGEDLNQLLTLVVVIKSETPCESELLLFAGMNDHLHAAGLLEPSREGGDSDVGFSNGRNTRVGSSQSRTKDKGGVHHAGLDNGVLVSGHIARPEMLLRGRGNFDSDR